MPSLHAMLLPKSPMEGLENTFLTYHHGVYAIRYCFWQKNSLHSQRSATMGPLVLPCPHHPEAAGLTERWDELLKTQLQCQLGDSSYSQLLLAQLSEAYTGETQGLVTEDLGRKRIRTWKRVPPPHTHINWKLIKWLQCMTWNSDSFTQNHREHISRYKNKQELSEENSISTESNPVCSVHVWN